MKRINKPLSLLLAAALLCCLLPTAAFAAAGTESDPIPLELGETVQHTPGEDVFYTLWKQRLVPSLSLPTNPFRWQITADADCPGIS